jgi:hypothetical protein
MHINRFANVKAQLRLAFVNDSVDPRQAPR